MAEKSNQSGSGGAEGTEDVEQAMGEATGDTLKAPPEVEDEPAEKDLPEGTESP